MKILLTGALGGFGQLISQALLQAGHTVVGTTRKIPDTYHEKNSSFTLIEMDVTSDQSVQTSVARAISLMSGIDVVINNAGQGVNDYLESFTAEDLKSIFDVNVFGVQRVIRAVLPAFKQQQNGLVINTSSLLGRLTVPFYGPYNASKWALEALSETYRYELSGLGIDVCMVEPGGYPTSFISNLVSGSNDRSFSYQHLTPTPDFFLENFEAALASNPAQNPSDVAEAFIKLIDTEKGARQMRTIVDKMGMGEHVENLNEQHKNITKGIFQAFHIDHMFEIKGNN